MEKLIGRHRECEELKRLFETQRAEFVAICGRRRVGKTFLVRQVFRNQFAFSHAGISTAELKTKHLLQTQLQNFGYSLRYFGLELDHELADWFEAFHELIRLLEQKRDGRRQVVFIDELPWLDTPRSGFISALENFWNGWGAYQDDLLLIVCGSATAWMMDKLINNHGGLYGRLTKVLHLAPFSLGECEEYYHAAGIQLSRFDQLQAYMIFGGIPFYLSGLKKGLSLVQNVDELFFRNNAPLSGELDRMFASLFVNHSDYYRIVSLLGTCSLGFSRNEISQKSGIKSGGSLTTILQSLISSDFIVEYIPYGSGIREKRYKLTDCFSLFCLHFNKKKSTGNPHFWQESFQTPAIRAWSGHAFENLCFLHLPQIKRALGISGVHCQAEPWYGKTKEHKAQIDMLLVRKDRVMNVCEMKYTQGEYAMTEQDDREIRRKLTVLQEETGTDYALLPTLITTFGLASGQYANIIQNTITMDALFEE